MTKYSKYIIKNNKRNSSFQFVESNRLPSKIPISTPFTFPFIGAKIVLCLDKNNWWNPLGGHMEKGEKYKDALVREAYEEAGVNIIKSSIKIIGYIKNINFMNNESSEFPAKNILPITISLVKSVDPDWTNLETSKRGLFTFEEAVCLMGKRNDNCQMFEVFNFVIKNYDNNFQVKFSYHPKKLFDNAPVTQVFTFCKNQDGNFCIVKDANENFYSLPGGQCELGEKPEKCARRELLEEAQVTCKNLQFLGSILVEIVQKGRTLSKSQHLRYIADVDKQDVFVPQKNNFETVERLFVPFAELEKKVFILQNPTAKKILDQIS
jgi:8-oxo-dGTP pyrophosphatase MutT (NUDIX family)